MENKNKISKAYRNSRGQLIREVDGVEIIQIEETTERRSKLNQHINEWRMSRK